MLVEFLSIFAWSGLLTVTLSLLSLCAALVFGATGAWMKLSASPFGRMIATVYTGLIRGVPPLVLMMLIYFGGQAAVNATAARLGLPRLEINAFLAGTLSIGFIFGAYLTENLRGAYLAIPRGTIEAGIALGMGRRALFSRVIGPQLVRLALPGFSNIWLTLMKTTALVSIIGLHDAVYDALSIGRSVRQPFTFMFVVLMLYLMLTMLSDVLLRWVGRWADRGVALPEEMRRRSARKVATP